MEYRKNFINKKIQIFNSFTRCVETDISPHSLQFIE
jgi:hypothetical protein